ncbi:MAG: DEAD/DEAH box helicase [Burkholderiales bacterium]|nr:DEAD/DEAH box helicase [Burkholderiales bacterium]
MPFSSIGLRPELLTAMAGRGYTQPTPVQMQAIPAVLQGRDVLACAPTGSGKTAAFALPLLQNLLTRERTVHREGVSTRQARVLVLVPTRELAIQVGATLRDVANRLAKPVKVTVVFGGVSINPQMLGLRGGTDVVVATPGRLLDLTDHNALTLRGVHTLVLDEADRMLDQAFGDEWAAISALLPAQRQNLLFSATFNRAIEAMAQHLLHDPVRISVQPPPEVPADITQRAIAVDAPRRTQLLRHLLTTERWSRVLVFVATQHAADTVAEKLRKARISAEPFHGGLSQGKRTQVLADFKLSRVKVVVATDVAARGLDIADLPVVVNFDLPRSADDHTHRIGRTGRAGATGLAISFVSADTEPHLRLIEKRHNLALMRETVTGFEPDVGPAEALAADVMAPGTDGPIAVHSTPGNRPPTTLGGHARQGLDPNGGIKGKRPSKKDRLRQQHARKP